MFFVLFFNLICQLLGSCLVPVQYNSWEPSSSAGCDWCWINANDYSFTGKGRFSDTKGFYSNCNNFLIVICAIRKFLLMYNLGSSLGSFKCNNQWTCRTSGIYGFTRCYTTVLCPTFYTWFTNCAGCPGWPQQYSEDGWTSLRSNMYDDWRMRRWLFLIWGSKTVCYYSKQIHNREWNFYSWVKLSKFFLADVFLLDSDISLIIEL